VGDSGSTVYFNGTGNQVLAVDAATGATKHSFTLGGEVWSTPALANQAIYVGCSDGKLYALRSSDLSVIWTSPNVGSRIVSSPLATATYVYAGSEGGQFYAFRVTDGTIAWSQNTGGPIYSSPAMGPDGTVYIGSNDGSVYALNGGGGVRWQFQTSGPVSASPALSPLTGNIYIGSEDSTFYAIGSDGAEWWRIPTNGVFDWRHSAAVTFPSHVPSIDRIFFGNDAGEFFIYESAAPSPASPHIKVFIGAASFNNASTTAPAVAQDGLSAFVANGHSLSRVDLVYGGQPGNLPRIDVTVVNVIPGSSSIVGNPSVNTDGTIYVSSDQGMYAFR
jgi:outer membrane protein assembly factor BamB